MANSKKKYRVKPTKKACSTFFEGEKIMFSSKLSQAKLKKMFEAGIKEIEIYHVGE